MAKLTYADEIDITEAVLKNPKPKTVEKLAKHYEVEFGDITRVLRKDARTRNFATSLTEANKIRQQEANEREKSKIVEIRQRKREITDGKWNIPKSISKSALLKVTPKQADILIQSSFIRKAFIVYSLETQANLIGYPIIKGKLPEPDENGIVKIPKEQITNQYDIVKAFLKKIDKKTDKLGVGAKTLDVLNRTKIKPMIQSSIRKPRMSNFVIPFQGTHGNTSGDAKVIKKNDKFYLRLNKIKMDLEILLQVHDDYYDSRIETPLLQLFDKGETPSGEIFRAKNKNWYVRFSLKRKEPIVKFDDKSKRVFIIIQPTFTQIGCKWIAYFYNELNQLIFKTTILRDVAWIRIPQTHKNFIKYYTNKAVEQLMDKSWHRKFQTLKPIVVILDAIGSSPSQIVANLNPIYKFRLKMQDKLAQYNGDGYTLSNCPNNIEEIRVRLSI